MNYRILFPVSLSLLFSSCYSIAIASQYLCLINKGQNIYRIKDPSSEEQLLFKRVSEIKNFAENHLGLRATKNYSRYVRLDRDYLTAVVSAAPELGFEDYLWRYPFVGKLPYRGYFYVHQAKKEAERLKQKGYDIFVRPVSAFSTLGYVRDPLFSYMTEYSETRLTELILHESFHATLFIRGDIAFNESLANLVGKYGAEIYMQQKYGAKAEQNRIAQMEESHSDRRKFHSMVLQLKETLSIIYQDTSLKREQALKAKKTAIELWKKQFESPAYEEIFETENYQYIAEYPINNAYLALFSLYEDPDNFLENFYHRLLSQKGDAQKALQEMISLSQKLSRKHGRETRQALKEYILQN